MTTGTTTQSVWAAIDTISGNEVYRFASSETNINYKFIVRYQPVSVIANDDQVEYQGLYFRIKHIDYGSFKRDYMTIYCEQDNAL